MLIWKNTSILNNNCKGLSITDKKDKAEIILMGDQYVDIDLFPNLKGIFRCGIGRDNVPEQKAKKKEFIQGSLQKILSK